MATKCKKCMSTILFVENKTGKWHPCDPQLLKTDDCDVGTVIVERDTGEIITVREGMESSHVGYTSHFATCPNAENFRRDHKIKKKENDYDN